MMVIFRCEKCSEECNSEKYHGKRSPFPPVRVIKEVNSIESAKKMEIKCINCGSNLKFLGVQSKNKKKKPTVKSTSPESKPIEIPESKPTGEPVYNGLKLNEKIREPTCTSCPYKPCAKSPEMVAICQVESLEYRLRSGYYNISSVTGAGEFPKDMKGIIIDRTPVYIEDIKRLFITRWDTYSLYNPKDAGKKSAKVPETYQPPTDDVLLRALELLITIGFRPVDPKKNLCKWICYDIDKHSCERTIYESNPRQVVDEIVNRLKKWYGLTGYIELSGSPDSYHIWIFINPTDYGLVKKFDDSFKERCEPTINQAICKRVEAGEGHMIKMPYTKNLKNGVRSKFIGGLDFHKIIPENLPNIN
jgi:hypothetical protein